MNCTISDVQLRAIQNLIQWRRDSIQATLDRPRVCDADTEQMIRDACAIHFEELDELDAAVSKALGVPLSSRTPAR